MQKQLVIRISDFINICSSRKAKDSVEILSRLSHIWWVNEWLQVLRSRHFIGMTSNQRLLMNYRLRWLSIILLPTSKKVLQHTLCAEINKWNHYWVWLLDENCFLGKKCLLLFCCFLLLPLSCWSKLQMKFISQDTFFWLGL